MPHHPLARVLGVFSAGLGVPQVVAPGAVNRFIGVEDDARSRLWMRLVGVRELVAAAGILGPAPTQPMLVARVLGDAKDLALLGIALDRRSTDARRTAGALAAVAGVTALDAFAAKKGVGRPEARAATTIRLPRELVEGHWRAHAPAWAAQAQVSFAEAPGDRGTEIHVRAAEAETRIKTDLRRFKAVMETGEVPKSDGAPEGIMSFRQVRQRPAQPVKP